jgi:hypothetical protein
VRLGGLVQSRFIQVPGLGISTLNPFAKLRADFERRNFERIATAGSLAGSNFDYQAVQKRQRVHGFKSLRENGLWRRIKAKSSQLNVYKSAPTRRAQFGSPIIFFV